MEKLQKNRQISTIKISQKGMLIRHIRNCMASSARRLMSHVYSCLCTFIGADFVFVPGCKARTAFLSILPFPAEYGTRRNASSSRMPITIGALPQPVCVMLAVPYKAMSVYAERSFQGQWNGWLGVGRVAVVRTLPGNCVSRRSYHRLAVAYRRCSGSSSLAGAGFNVGWANESGSMCRRLGSGSVATDVFLTTALPTSCQLTSGATELAKLHGPSRPVSAELHAYFHRRIMYINAGCSVRHMSNKPRETFFADRSDNGRIPMQHIGLVNHHTESGAKRHHQPEYILYNQVKTSELVQEWILSSIFSNRGETVAGGFVLPVQWCIIPMRFQLQNVRFSFTYDAISSLSKISQQLQGAQLNLMLPNMDFIRNQSRQAVTLPYKSSDHINDLKQKSGSNFPNFIAKMTERMLAQSNKQNPIPRIPGFL